MLPLQVLDYRVAVYSIFESFKNIEAQCSSETSRTWLKAVWAIYFNRGFTGNRLVPHTCVTVDDSSPYWRSEYLEKRGFAPYKGGRPAKSDCWYRVDAAGKAYISAAKSPLFYFCYPGYEADDIAAALVRVAPKRQIFLHTVDSDWLGLIRPGVTWCNMGVWTPRIRNKDEAIAWALKRLKVKIDVPSDIWKVKQYQGDKSDNLKPGSPLEVIDLLNPPPEHDLLNNELVKQCITEVANTNTDTVTYHHLKSSLEWMRRNGFSVPMVNFQVYPIDLSPIAS